MGTSARYLIKNKNHELEFAKALRVSAVKVFVSSRISCWWMFSHGLPDKEVTGW